MNILDFKRKKQEQNKITMVTCYDHPSACMVAESNVDCVLVGDSVAMAVHGHKTTLMATIDMMLLHTAAVARGLKKQFLITDLPFLSHKIDRSEMMKEVRNLIQAGAHALKIEGADPHTLDSISYLVQSGIPVMGHIGLRSQAYHQLGGHKIQGKTQEQADLLLQEALNLEKAGCFALVIECVPQPLAQLITQNLNIPTIGIGAGVHTDGQVLVWHDLLGLQDTFNPKFVKKYAQAKSLMIEGLNQYVYQVQNRYFPSAEHVF